MSIFGFGEVPLPAFLSHIVLPVGISFYTFQGISSGGRAQAGHDTAHLLSGNLVARLDTEKADLWKGGFWNVRL